MYVGTLTNLEIAVKDKMWELSQIVDLPVVPYLNTISYKFLFFKLW
ncbi:hypothetical protein LEP1GSC082_0576 [Leptospira kirschneri str. H2]|uniref:Uncharacterized protein n=2 Tax=Leptospira kirschneri TaxID=29507 RepID=A0A0E2B8A0_9LEPT|nr:hypothetical protein LEP1GSC081_0514 [Leptospira kirschneri str. H1]EKO61900.1 hypothetical protein LEP1GSC082_0576 [Leptospira kirschneri str. H2]EMK24208.1 hypothetical protein LEP1GSC008_0075 [Leptospira kirschneri serovar Bulgarica str. Nikolaevo]